MSRNWSAVLNRIETSIMSHVTTLKVRVVLLVDGEKRECGEFDNSPKGTREAGNWMAQKASYYRVTSPLCVVRFVTE